MIKLGGVWLLFGVTVMVPRACTVLVCSGSHPIPTLGMGKGGRYYGGQSHQSHIPLHRGRSAAVIRKKDSWIVSLLGLS